MAIDDAMRGRRMAAKKIIWCGLLATLLVGCSGSGLDTHSVQGKLEMADGDVKALTGSIIEFMQQENPLVRANGKINDGGAFTMETLHKGEILSGVPKGKYDARIVWSNEDENGNPKKGGPPLNKRFMDFKTSTWSVTVPSDQGVVLKASKS